MAPEVQDRNPAYGKEPLNAGLASRFAYLIPNHVSCLFLVCLSLSLSLIFLSPLGLLTWGKFEFSSIISTFSCTVRLKLYFRKWNPRLTQTMNIRLGGYPP